MPMNLDTSNSSASTRPASTPVLTLRGSFFVLASTLALMGLTQLLWHLARTSLDTWGEHAGQVWLRIGLLGVAVFIATVFAGLKRNGFNRREELVTYAGGMVLAVALVLLASQVGMATVTERSHSIYWALGDLIFIHFALCLIVPVTPRESIPPIILPWVFWVLAMVIGAGEGIPTFNRIILPIISPL
ncbi:MAG: hypothetical protein AAF432_06975, partial [Planctomycetota bacterium]